jgi:DNA-binding LacI/PurR family transcriptional regulator
MLTSHSVQKKTQRRTDPNGRKYPSSTEVAKLAGVSQSAVSRTFTQGGSVSERTRRKVIKATEALGYSPNILPKILQTNRSGLVAVVIGEMSNPYYAQILEAFCREIQSQGNRVVLCSVNHGEYVDDAIPMLASYRVDGIITAHPIWSEAAARRSEKLQVPIVLVNGRVRSNWVSSVCSDNLAASRDVANLFLQYGAKRFGYITGQETLADEERSTGFFNRLKEAGITNIQTAVGDFHYEGGYQGALKLMKQSGPPHAIFCANDMMAIGAIEAIRTELGLRIPQDVMIAGFDDIPSAALKSYSLTTVRPDVEKIVQQAISILKSKVQGAERSTGLLRLVRPTLVQRGTTTGWIKKR